jgi:hypothetical protein
MPGQAKDPTQGKCVTCCGLPFFNIVEVGITGPKWHKIKTTVICKKSSLHVERTQKKFLIRDIIQCKQQNLDSVADLC